MNGANVNLDDGASFDELTNALKETLNRKGALRQIRSALRTEAFVALQQAGESNAAEDFEKSFGCEGGGKLPLCPENAVINELIREYMYLEFNGYSGTASVLAVEAGISSTCSDNGYDKEKELCREMMKIELGVNENTNEKRVGRSKSILKRRKNG